MFQNFLYQFLKILSLRFLKDQDLSYRSVSRDIVVLIECTFQQIAQSGYTRSMIFVEKTREQVLTLPTS